MCMYVYRTRAAAAAFCSMYIISCSFAALITHQPNSSLRAAAPQT